MRTRSPCTRSIIRIRSIIRKDVFAINPEQVTGGARSAFCGHRPTVSIFSRAKGGKPVDKKIRGLSWVILKWAMSERSAPRCIFMENVEEIQTWGPADGDRRKDETGSSKGGETFKGFLCMLTSGIGKEHAAFLEACEFLELDPDGEAADKLARGLGYTVDYRVLKACDYGAPTIRKRFYLVARRDGLRSSFPNPRTERERNHTERRQSA